MKQLQRSVQGGASNSRVSWVRKVKVLENFSKLIPADCNFKNNTQEAYFSDFVIYL